MHMIAPVSAGTESVVWVTNSIHTMPASAAGSAVMMTNGSSQDWKLTTIRKIDEHDGERQADVELAEGRQSSS